MRDKGHSGPDEASRAWLDADLAPPLPPFDWGAGAPPEGKAVTYVRGMGPVVEGGKQGSAG